MHKKTKFLIDFYLNPKPSNFHICKYLNAQIFRYSNLRSPNFYTSILRIRRFSNFQTVKLFDQTSRIPICDLYKYSNTTKRVTMVKVANRSYEVQLAIVIDIDRRIRVICSHVNRNARKRKKEKDSEVRRISSV